MYKKVIIISIISFFIDQITKLIIDTYLHYGDTISIIKGFFYLTRTTNTGAAFSMLEGKTVLFLIISVITIIVLFKYIKSFKNKLINNLAFGLIIGGIIGNFFDRLIFSYVRDFIRVDIFSYNFPIFNIADSCIVIGVILLCISIIRGGEDELFKN